MADASVCTCGAMLPSPDSSGHAACLSCGRVTTSAAEPTAPAPSGSTPAPAAGDPAPTAGGSSAWPEPPVAAGPPGNPWAPPAGVPGAPRPAPTPGGAGGAGGGVAAASGPARRIGCAVVPLAIGLVVVISLVGALRSCDTNAIRSKIDPNVDPYASTIVLGGTASVLPGEEGATDLLVTTQETTGGSLERRVTRLRFTNGGATRVWASEVLDDSLGDTQVAVADDVIFVGTEDLLLALDAADGSTRWRTTLRDDVTLGCPGCFEVVDGTLVVRTKDAYVTGFAPDDPEPRWSNRLRSPAGSVSVANGHLLVVDDPEDPSGRTAVALLDPATGKVRRATTPTCTPNPDTPWNLELDAGDEILPAGDSSDVVAAFGFGDSCVVRWDPSSGEVKWTTRLNGASTIDADRTLVGDADLVLSTSGAIVTLDLKTGSPRQLEVPADTNAVPDRIVGRTLVADVATTRGTPENGLAAWDLASGRRLWANTSLGEATPTTKSRYQPSDALFDGSPRSLLVPTGEGLNVFTFRGEDHTFAVRPVDLATGTLGTEVRRAFFQQYAGIPSMSVEHVGEDRVFITIDSQLQALPLAGSGEVIAFPQSR